MLWNSESAMMTLSDLMELVDEAIGKAGRDLGRVNVLIAGRTGVGKSTLINSVFHEDFVDTGQGRPVTRTTRLIAKEGVPLGIWDTRGLEMSDFEETLGELMQLIEARAREPEIQDHIHVAWICLHEDLRRVEDAETKLCTELAERMPVLGVITKARQDNGFRAKVQRLLPETRNVVRVRAIEEKLDELGTLPPMGLDTLVEATRELLPEGIRAAWIAAQKVKLERKKQQAHRVVAAAAASAFGTAAVPIPFAGALVLVPIQIGMLAGISVIFGFDVSRSFLRVLATTAIGAPGTTLTGRVVAANLLKLIPGAGALLGGMISAVTAAALTTALGEVYIASLAAAFAKADGQTPDTDSVEHEFKERMLIRTGEKSG